MFHTTQNLTTDLKVRRILQDSTIHSGTERVNQTIHWKFN